MTDSFYSVQRLIRECFESSGEDERRGLGVMVEMRKVSGKNANGTARVIDVTQGKGSARKSAKNAKG